MESNFQNYPTGSNPSHSQLCPFLAEVPAPALQVMRVVVVVIVVFVVVVVLDTKFNFINF